MWSGTHASIPAGWSRVTDLDGKFIKVADEFDDPNVTGGGANHQHTSPAHSHSILAHLHTISLNANTAGSNSTGSTSSGGPSSSHGHQSVNSGAAVGGGLSSIAATYDSIASEPRHKTVIFITPTLVPQKAPNNAIVLHMSSDIPDDWVACDGNNSTPNYVGYFLKGANTGADASNTEQGADTHTHTISHTHTETGHTHARVQSGAYTATTDFETASGTADSVQSHSHDLDLNSNTMGYSGTPTSGTGSNQPLNKKILAIQNQTGGESSPLGILGIWLGNLADIPSGWELVETFYSRHLKITATPAEVGDEAGSNTHTHSDNHSHTGASHTHSATVEVQGATNNLLNSGHSLPKPHGHTANVGSSAPNWSTENTTGDSANQEPPYRTIALIQYTGQSISGKASILGSGVVKSISGKGRVQHSREYSVTAKSRTKIAGVTKTIRARANMSVNPSDWIFPNRTGSIEMGFDGKYAQMFKGHSKLPKVDLRNRVADIHFYDELEKIASHKLSGGSLELDVRTDRYIWGILDEVYANYFDELASCDTAESWVGSTDETTNHRYGTAAQKLESSGSAEEATLTVAKDMSIYDRNDYIDFQLYVPDIAEHISFIFTLTDGSANEVTWTDPEVVAGWNSMRIELSDLVGFDDFDFSDITEVKITFQADTSSYVFVDEIRFVEREEYPKRIFDAGLQNIPIAWWSSNTALFEIKESCEAEGARFYSDEDGNLHFQNRQYFNNTDSSKVSIMQFDFDNTMDIQHTTVEDDLINTVIVRLKPRTLQAEQVVWTYGFTPKYIANGDTIEVWAELIDPCPDDTSGLPAPIATTDYTANTQADGGGSDKTAQISIVLTRFTNAVLYEITNNDASPVYLTFLQQKGTPAQESDETRVNSQDATSVAQYGARPAHGSQAGGYVIENKYMADESYAQSLADQIVEWYKSPVRRMVLRNRSVPTLRLGDMITVNHQQINANYLMRVIGLKNRFSLEGMNQDITCRMVTPFELLSFFEIEASSIGSTDVIAP